MKVALCSPNFPPEFLGGTERVVLAIAQVLRELGDEVVVVAGSDVQRNGTDVLVEDCDGIAVRRLPRAADEGYGLVVRRPRVAAAFEEVLLAEGVDVVHVHHWATLTSALLRTAAARGVPGVATLHDMWIGCPRFFRRSPSGVVCPDGARRGPCVPCVRQGIPDLAEEVVERGIATRDEDLREELAAARRVTAPSAACRDLVREHAPWEGPIEVVPHGLLEAVGPQERAVARQGGPLRVGTFGNLVEEKGVMLLVWACRGIPDLELHLAGPFLDPSFGTAVREKAAAFGVRLVEHGAYGRRDPHPALRLDVAVFPSFCEETYGLVVEEALARGVPVVVSDRGALAERIGAGGVAVSVDELGPLENVLREIARDRPRLDALRAGIPRSFATVRDAAMRYRAIYGEVLAEVSA